MTNYLFIRHGQTDWNVARRWQGHQDIPLNENGLAQAAAVASRLADVPITAIHSSDLQRASQTAVAIAAHHDLPVYVDPAWRERDVGIFAGLTSAEIREKYPQHMTGNSGSAFVPPEGEHPNDIQARMVGAFEALLPQYEVGQVVVVVSHGGSLAALVRHILGLPLDADRKFRIGGNTGITEVNIHPQLGPVLTKLNDTAHLEPYFQ